MASGWCWQDVMARPGEQANPPQAPKLLFLNRFRLSSRKYETFRGACRNRGRLHAERTHRDDAFYGLVETTVDPFP
jgi:hypothetical protein